ncbi:MAG: Putative periplasmic cytochrome type-C oxidoreductase signal peptide protein [Burkholderiaceae bacterium]|jgi:cytochrome c553|nr:MAG: Putative periplasmic cytochrome type-C oxidoreductase signal peptide protein [Burkholderiaceae bacterium]
MNKLLTAALALSVACVTTVALAQELKGDAAAGKAKASMCFGCHGIPEYKASFPEVYEVPKLAGQGAQYIEAALHEYKKGERKFPTMRAIAAPLTDQDIADLAAFYSTQAGPPVKLAATPNIPPSPKVAAILAKANCAACHGANFSTPIAPTYPELAGQHASYLLAALRQYKTKGNPNFGRGNPIMGGMVATLSDDDLKALADYIGSLDGNLKTVAESRFQ